MTASSPGGASTNPSAGTDPGGPSGDADPVGAEQAIGQQAEPDDVPAGTGEQADTAAAERSMGSSDRSADGSGTIPPLDPDEPDPAADRDEARESGTERGTPQNAASRSEPHQPADAPEDPPNGDDGEGSPTATSPKLDEVQGLIDTAKDSAKPALRNRLAGEDAAES